jgi:hypothetical protein
MMRTLSTPKLVEVLLFLFWFNVVFLERYCYDVHVVNPKSCEGSFNFFL